MMKTSGNGSNILVFRIGSLGDTLVSLPAFHLLREQYPKSSITLLTNTPVDGGIKAAPSHQILMGSGLIDQYIEYPHGRLDAWSVAKLVLTIRKLKPAHVIYLMPVRSRAQRARDFCLFLAAGVWNVRGLVVDRECDSHRKLSGSERYESEAGRLVRSIGFSDTPLTQSLFSLVLQDSERGAALKALGNLGLTQPIIALSMGAKVPAKDWGADLWKGLLQKLKNDLGEYSLVFLGSQDEYDRCENISVEWPGVTLNLCGQLTPRQSAAVLERAALFVGHDSGPMHLASSVGIPCIAIFAARSRPGVWFPFGNEDNVFYNDVSCSNCGLSVCDKNKMVCIRSIQPELVAARITSLLLTQTNHKVRNH